MSSYPFLRSYIMITMLDGETKETQSVEKV